MKFHKQKFLHRPEEGTYGDCDRTAMACLLDLEVDDVPHWGVHYGDNIAFNKMKDDWLATQGLYEQHIAFDCSFDELKNNLNSVFRNVYVLLTGTSANGTTHVVITLNGEIIHDPAIDNSGIVGPCDDGLWQISILIPRILLHHKGSKYENNL